MTDRIEINRVRGQFADREDTNVVLCLGQNEFVSGLYASPSNARRRVRDLVKKYFQGITVVDNTLKRR